MKFDRTEINARHRTLLSPPYPSYPFLVGIIGGYIWVLVKTFLPFFGLGLVCGFYWTSWNGLFLVWYSWKILSASSLSYGKSPCLVCHLHCAWSHVDCTGVCAGQEGKTIFIYLEIQMKALNQYIQSASQKCKQLHKKEWTKD